MTETRQVAKVVETARLLQYASVVCPLLNRPHRYSAQGGAIVLFAASKRWQINDGKSFFGACIHDIGHVRIDIKVEV